MDRLSYPDKNLGRFRALVVGLDLGRPKPAGRLGNGRRNVFYLQKITVE